MILWNTKYFTPGVFVLLNVLTEGSASVNRCRNWRAEREGADACL